jgi:hypothetical protein
MPPASTYPPHIRRAAAEQCSADKARTIWLPPPLIAVPVVDPPASTNSNPPLLTLEAAT